ncbi:hypothetical protein BJ684DRAFT_20803 [Piptocephalis cylindrospora]|uniref:ER membrane protein complex subunit 2 n=1 Tax=Piptocephalis cylindrospora TaxID=1907219 RepID=A0A4P9Y1X8_9FUNG|nr:hypothetical protein BJ684DRAFT_20803 [Piptocephalis cylindrospora]|eukprot:RKP12674.1 hypothetical protein BJ684DRAFT_20803 [Piptocephalis cylindrospora]
MSLTTTVTSDPLEVLSELRRTGERRSDVVMRIGGDLLLYGKTRSLGDEAWLIYEQVFDAALDLADWEAAQACLEMLQEKFPVSKRVRLLDGKYHEARGILDVAEQIYDEILAEDETHVMALKRKVALLKTKGDIKGAIGKLVEYVDCYTNDLEAWMELSALYQSQCMYKQAAYCQEELILLQPIHHLHQITYAEIMYTLNQMEVAAKSYCRALELSTAHPRALYGLKQCILKLGGASRCKGVNHAKELDLMVIDQLTKAYEKACPRSQGQELRKVVDTWLES